MNDKKKVAIITIAGISSRFNEGIEEDKKVLKCLYTEGGKEETLLYHLMKKCSFADHIILVGGYKFEDLCAFYKKDLAEEFPDVTIVLNEHYSDLGSGYSLYLGIKSALRHDPEEILFVEGDLDIDNESFAKVVDADKSVLTYTYEPIYANKAVVLYKDEKDEYRYAFNSSHGLLTIDSPFSCILNSGQTWKFTQVDKLKAANDMFIENDRADTNLRIIQNYLDAGAEVDLVALNRWTNCNTRDDYRKIVSYWEEEK